MALLDHNETTGFDYQVIAIQLRFSVTHVLTLAVILVH